MTLALGEPEPPAGDDASAALTRAWQEASEGSVVVLNLIGPADAGKTTTVDAWLSDRSPELVFRSWVPYEPATTFRPLADMVETAAGIDRSDPADEVRRKLGGLEGLDPAIVRRLAHVAGDRSSVFPNHEIFWGARLFLEHVARRGPVAVVWEGLERAEETFLDMLEYLAGRVGRALIVTTGRPEVLRARPHWDANGGSSFRVVTLEGPASEGDDPFGSLDDEDRLTAGIAAVIGESFPLDVLLVACPPEVRERIAASVSRLESAGVFRRRPGVTESTLTFGSGASWARARGDLGDRTEAGVHERLASYLEECTADRAAYDEMIAFHLEFAIERAKPAHRKTLVNRAVGRLAGAGRRALGRSDAPAAVDLLERGAVLIDDADTRRPRLLLSLCDGLLDLGDIQRIGRIADAGLREAREMEDVMAVARFGVWRQIALSRLRPDQSGVDKEEQLRVAKTMERAGEHLGAAEAYQAQAEHLWEELDYLAAEGALDRALTNARAANHLRLESKIAAWLMFSFFWGPRPATSGIERCESFSGDFSADRLLEANRLTTLGGLYGLTGEFERGRALLLRGREIQEDLGQPLVISWNPQIGATVALLEGDPKEAEHEARLAFEEAQHMADPGHAATGASLLAKALYAQGRVEEAFQYTRLAERASLGAPEAAQSEWKCVRAKLDARRGNIERATAEIKGALDFFDAGAMPRDRADALVDLAEILAMAGRLDDERVALDQALELYEKKGVAPAVAKVRSRLKEIA